ncbi:hypothetical protein C2845_PM14G08690 [Panicum miliaceum]|uniref:Uncharacterized protein n=1 Tax=Panicum miliaceum TaxID=4540 RepID=A0A3L6PPH7_PANMI|nr:hypothetical protein C2845_PM14G08690 [Panicum miliaceum]
MLSRAFARSSSETILSPPRASKPSDGHRNPTSRTESGGSGHWPLPWPPRREELGEALAAVVSAVEEAQIGTWSWLRRPGHIQPRTPPPTPHRAPSRSCGLHAHASRHAASIRPSRAAIRLA